MTRDLVFQRIVILTLALAAFGPYVTGSIRTEQIAVYAVAAFAVVFRLPSLRAGDGLKLLVPWLILVTVASLGFIFPSHLTVPWESGNALAGLDNLLLPVALMLLVWCMVKADHAAAVLRTAGHMIVGLTAANGLLAIISTRVNTAPFLEVFWGSTAAEGETTAFYAAQLGRFSGIFNQPAEAGVVYGLAALLSIHLYKSQNLRLILALTFITLGGLISVSKVFILGGIPLMVIYLWKSRTVSGKAGFLVSTLLLLGGVSQTGWLQSWSGFNYLARLIAPEENQSLIEFYTAGRWNQGSSITSVMGIVMDVSPFAGAGIAGWKVPYDSGWTEAMVLGGGLGVLAHAILILGLFALARQTVNDDRRRFTYFFTLFLVGADLGIPAFTANRVATVVWLVLALLMLASRLEGDTPAGKAKGVREVREDLPSPAYRQLLSQRQSEPEKALPTLS